MSTGDLCDLAGRCSIALRFWTRTARPWGRRARYHILGVLRGAVRVTESPHQQQVAQWAQQDKGEQQRAGYRYVQQENGTQRGYGNEATQ
ncbi:MAG TPA: hypothetical protein G4O02_08630 [Caldilineae bacterium]|nr:hypothetical protein [Caldilineae bacterium]